MHFTFYMKNGLNWMSMSCPSLMGVQEKFLITHLSGF